MTQKTEKFENEYSKLIKTAQKNGVESDDIELAVATVKAMCDENHKLTTMKSNLVKLMTLVHNNPNLPVVTAINRDVVGDDYADYAGNIGNSYIDEYTVCHGKLFCSREDFKEYYYNTFSDELDDSFSDKTSINDFLDKLANERFAKAIIVNIDVLEN